MVELAVRKKPKGLYGLIGGAGNGEINSATIHDFIVKNPKLDPETLERLLAWEKEFKFWEKNAEILPHGEHGLPYRNLLKTIEGFADPKPDEIWLDAQCGAARMSELIWEKSEKSVKKIIGLDIVLGPAEKREREIPILEVKYGNLGERLEFPDSTFDGIINGTGIPFVFEFEASQGKEGLQKVFCELARVLKPGGGLIWSTPIRNIRMEVCLLSSIPDMIKHPWLIKIAPPFLKYIMDIKKKGKEGIYTYLSPTEWDEMLKKAGFVNSTWKFVLTYQAWVNRSLRGVPLEGVF